MQNLSTVSTRKALILIGCSIAFSIVLACIPLFNFLGYEFALAMAATLPLGLGLFWLSEQQMRKRFITTSLALALPPLIMLLATLFVKNCAYLEGLGFYGLAVGFGAVFAISVALVIESLPLRAKKTLFVLIYFALLLIAPLYRFYTSPQVYFFNHIFGFFAGSIYDDAIEIEPRYLFFRLETLAISGALLTWRFRSSMRPSLLRILLLSLLSAAIFLWLQSEELGITSSRHAIMRKLVPIDSAKLWYASPTLSEKERTYLRRHIELELSDLQRMMELDSVPPIYIFIYPDAETKKRFTGLDKTEIARVWMNEIHITQRNIDTVLRHELVHILMKPFGDKWLGLSRSIGLLEGIAMALETPSFEWTLDEMSANFFDHRPDFNPKALFNPLGFWTGLSATSYTLSGSFVKYLLKTHGMDAFKRVYATADFEEVYGQSLDELLIAWLEHLNTVVVPPQINPYYKQVFERKTIFQIECPHSIARLLKKCAKMHQQGQYEQASQIAAQVLKMSGGTNAEAAQRYLSARLMLAHQGKAYFEEIFAGADSLLQEVERPERAWFTLANAMLWSKAAPIDSAQQILERLYRSHLSFEFDVAIATRLKWIEFGLEREKLSPLLTAAEKNAFYQAVLDTSTDHRLKSFLRLLQAEHTFEQKDFSQTLELLGDAQPLNQRDLDLRTEMMRLQSWLWTGRIDSAMVSAERAKQLAFQFANSKAKRVYIDHLLNMHSQYLEFARQ